MRKAFTIFSVVVPNEETCPGGAGDGSVSVSSQKFNLKGVHLKLKLSPKYLKNNLELDQPFAPDP